LIRVQKWIRDNCFSIFLFLAVLILEFRFYYRTSDDKQLYTDFLNAWGSQTFRNVCSQVAAKVSGDVLKWSSRVIINLFANFLVLLFPVWAVCNALVTVLFHARICRIFRAGDTRGRALALGLMLLMPIEIYRSCGWIVGTVSYYWPVVFLITAFSILLEKSWQHSGKAAAVMLACLIYACNEEIICVAVFLCLWIWLVLHPEDKKIVLVLQAVCVAELLWILFCPGNRIRYSREPGRWFPRFETLSVLHRMEMGFTSTMNRFWLRTCPVSAALGVVLLALAFVRKRSGWMKFLAGVPLVVALAGWAIKENAGRSRICSAIYYSEGQYGSLGLFNYTDPLRYLPLIFYICIGGIILILIMDLGNYSRAFIAVSLTLLAVTASRCIMGFTPTIWVSARRTYSLMYWVLILIIGYEYQQISRLDPERKIAPLCLAGTGLCSAFAVMDLMALL
jgi:hypothetical protein